MELRGGLIPSGNCVPDGDNTAVSTTFAEIDAGRSDERLLVLAQNACQMCVQINHCTVQTDHIATELWQRGAGIVIAGGTKVTLSHKERPVDEDRPILRFNLSAIPEDPADAVAIIRQAFRAGQFNATGPTPKGVRQAQQAYLGRLEQTDAGLHTRLSTMEKSELDSCMKFVLTALFQQKDFVNYAAGQDHYVGAARESTRYHSKYINPEKDDPIIGIFLQDALAIRDMQLSQIASKAAHFEPGYYAELIKKYKTDDITLKEFDTKVIHARINPVQAIVKHQATVGRIHGEQPDISPAAAREAARRGSKTLLSKEKLQTLIETYRSDSISAQQVIQFAHKNPGSPEAALDGLTARVEHLKTLYPAGHPTVRDVEIVAFAQGYRTLEGCQAAAQQFDNNMQALTAEYGDDPDITPSDIRKYSGMQDGHNAIATFKERISMLRETVGEDVSDSVIRQCARSGVTSPLEVQSKYTQTVLRDRYAYRARTKPEYKPLSSELIERIVTLYPRSETDQVAQTIFELIKRDYLVLGRAETYAQHGQLPEVFDKIFTPKTQEYLTFSGALGQLLPIQRLAFAHHHGLMPILYGTASSSVLFEQSALDGATINDYYTTHVEPQLAAYEASNTPMSLSLLAMDSAEYERLLRQDNRLLINDADRLTAYGLRDATLVVAGKALYLHEDTYRWDWAEHATDFDAWLTQKISTTYPPAHQKRAWTYIQEAIHGGVLDLLGSHPGEYQLVFNKQFYGPDVTEVQRTVVANAMGIDRLMYGSDLTNALRYRLATSRNS